MASKELRRIADQPLSLRFPLRVISKLETWPILPSSGEGTAVMWHRHVRLQMMFSSSFKEAGIEISSRDREGCGRHALCVPP